MFFKTDVIETVDDGFDLAQTLLHLLAHARLLLYVIDFDRQLVNLFLRSY